MVTRIIARPLCLFAPEFSVFLLNIEDPPMTCFIIAVHGILTQFLVNIWPPSMTLTQNWVNLLWLMGTVTPRENIKITASGQHLNNWIRWNYIAKWQIWSTSVRSKPNLLDFDPNLIQDIMCILSFTGYPRRHPPPPPPPRFSFSLFLSLR